MWFLGLLAGAVAGAIGGTAGAFIGALVGAVAGWAVSANRAPALSDRLREVEVALRRLNQRVKVLEEAIPAAQRTATAPAAETQQASSSDSISKETALVPSPLEAPPLTAVRFQAEAKAQPTEQQPTSAAPSVLAPEHEATRPPAAPPPQQPSALWNFFFGPNALVRFGIIVLFFGVAFLLKYAAENVYIPIEVRLICVAFGAIVLLAIGWSLRLSRPGYGLIMQGGGIGVLYLTVFAAFRLYELLPSGLVFVLLAAMAVLSAMLAVMQDSRALASMGVSGGFLAPLLASTGGGSHVMLFSFYTLVNFGILAIAWYKAWRSLNLLGFIFTFVIGLIWGNRYYRPELFASTEPFLILFFLFYVTIAVLFAICQEATIKSRVDGSLVFGTPLIAFGLQSALVRDIEYGAAFSALAVSFFYLSLAKVLYARVHENLRLLVEAFIALGVVFVTLAIPRSGLDPGGRWRVPPSSGSGCARKDFWRARLA